MKAIDVGSICIKTAGRKAGEKVVVTEIIDNNFVTVKGQNVNGKKCNMTHLFPTGKTIKVTKEMKREDFEKLK